MFKKNTFNRTSVLFVCLLFVLTLCVPINALAADSDIIVFPDANLKQALLVQGIDTNGDGGISQGELAAKTVLNLSNKGIASITGLEYAVNLKTLDISFNKISSISPLAGLANIASLFMQNNSIADIAPAANMKGLVTLNCQNNNIADLTPLSGLTALTELNISGNKVTNIAALSGLTNLSALDASSNTVQNIGVLSALTKLKTLSVTYMNLTDISFLSTLKNLVDLNFSHNSVTDISVVSGLTNLQSLRFYYNNVKNIAAVSPLDNLHYLNISHCVIEDISPLGSLKTIQSVVVTYNNLNVATGSAPLSTINALKAKGVAVSYSPQNSYKVTFNPQGGSSVKSATVVIYSTVKAPASPTRSGYAFGGWYKEPACVNAWNFASDKVTGNITLFAKWIGRTYTITFDSRGGTAVSSQTTGYKGKIVKPANPIRAGYIFGGWYKDSKCTKAWKFSSDKVTKSITLYAKWSAPKYTIKAYANKSSYGSVKGSGTYYAGKQATLKAVPKPGYYFIRWLEGSTAVSTNPVFTFTVNASQTFKAEFGKSKTPVLTSAKSAGFDSIQIAWKGVSGASGYLVYRATSANGTYKQVANTGGVLSYTDTGLKTGKSYFYKARAYFTVDSVTAYGAFSNSKSAKPKAAAPVISAVQKSSSSAQISWGKVSGATAYVIYRAETKNGSYKQLRVIAGTEFLNTGLTKGKTYYYKVKACQQKGKTKVYSSHSNTVSVKVK